MYMCTPPGGPSRLPWPSGLWPFALSPDQLIDPFTLVAFQAFTLDGGRRRFRHPKGGEGWPDATRPVDACPGQEYLSPWVYRHTGPQSPPQPAPAKPLTPQRSQRRRENLHRYLRCLSTSITRPSICPSLGLQLQWRGGSRIDPRQREGCALQASAPSASASASTSTSAQPSGRTQRGIVRGRYNISRPDKYLSAPLTRLERPSPEPRVSTFPPAAAHDLPSALHWRRSPSPKSALPDDFQVFPSVPHTPPSPHKWRLCFTALCGCPSARSRLWLLWF